MAGNLPASAPGDPWRGFPVDPRLPENTDLRSSDADRDRVHSILANAYAEGRLTRAELDERTDGVARSRTLGELPAYFLDLIPAKGADGLVRRDDLRSQALELYRKNLREAMWGFLSASLICWVIWGWTTGLEGFQWPWFVMLGTGIHVARTRFVKTDLIDSEVRRLERKQEKALEKQQRRELPPGEDHR